LDEESLNLTFPRDDVTVGDENHGRATINVHLELEDLESADDIRRDVSLVSVGKRALYFGGMGRDYGAIL
jgi:hypothetical protein